MTSVHARRLEHQLLTEPLGAVRRVGSGKTSDFPTDPRADLATAVVCQLLAVQAQDDRGARLAIRSRTTPGSVDASDVDAALADRRLVVSWLNRGTLHLVRAEDECWLHQLTAPRLGTGNARRLRQEGVSPEEADRGVDVIVATLAAEGPSTRRHLGMRLAEAGVPTAGQALVHLLFAATIRGHVVRGPMVAGHQAFVLAEAWLGPRPVLERDEALARLARRYLTGHGPADARDLATWVGLPLGDARRALAAVADETHDDGDGRVALDAPDMPVTLDGGRHAAHRASLPAPRLLGAFDPLLHGWASRDEVVGEHRGIVTSNGVFRPIALVDGRAVATWTLSDGRLRIRPLAPISDAAQRALQVDAGDVVRYLGLPPRHAEWDALG